ncbi:hypothetical protein Y5W_00768 [Alcanivorax sp. 521-1]|uniref:TM2 domain-containing protein n=1 Tax=Alloalcanivorax profundimaris TaxID=2735259 RepID=A0ABS0AMW0_9GAMM|nr:NINE protein [Alloalcanivorax profundimaris]MBF5055474.1 hypothetical protein [Alloalcanivorax profundimaris]
MEMEANSPAQSVVPHRQEPIPIGFAYLVWFFLGVFGGHRYMLGRPLTGLLWNLTLGVFLIGWIVDAFLIGSMTSDANKRFAKPVKVDYVAGWLCYIFLGVFGVHRFYMRKYGTGVLYLLTLGLLGVGLVYDLFTLSRQISDQNQRKA